MRTIAVMNQKGGSGKTTSAVNLAACLGELGKRVLVLDIDAQGNASKHLGVNQDGGKGLLEVFTDARDLAELAVTSSAPGVDIVPSSEWLSAADRILASEVGAELALRTALERLSKRAWDFVLVDCPPSLGLLVVASLTACAEVLIPVEALPYGLDGLAKIAKTIERVRERLNPSLRIAGVLPCRCDGRLRVSAEVIDGIRQHFPADIFETVIRTNVRLSEAPSHRKPITLYDRASTGATDYAAAARELLERTPRVQRTKRKPS